MRILFITHLLPYPPDRGGYIRTYNILRCLSENHNVDLVSYLFREEDKKYIKEFGSICNEVNVIPLRRSPIFPNLLFSLFSNLPFSYLRDYSKKMKNLITRKIEENEYDIVFEEQLNMVGYVPERIKAFRIYANILIGAMMMDRYSHHQKNPIKKILAKIESNKLKKLEKKTCSEVDLVITISDEEKDVIKNWGIPIDKIITVGMGVDTDKFRPVSLNNDSMNIVNLGLARFPPNVDAIFYFYNEIYPKIKKKLPDARSFVVGAEPPKSVQRLEEDKSIKVLGFVDNLDEFLIETGVFIIPLRIGGGVKVRLMNALAMGLPIVTTSIGVEGIEATHMEDLIVSDTAEEFAEAVIKILTNQELKKKLCINGPRLINNKYSWEIIFNQINNIFSQIEKQRNLKFMR